MDNLTHSLFALTLANAGIGRRDAGATAVLLLSSNAPDVDIVTAFTGGAVRYLAEHRGATHGPIGLVTLAALTAALVRVCQTGDRRAQTSFRRLWAIAGVGVVCHALMDFPTSYFMRPWAPFDMTWIGADWLPIADVYLLLVLAIGLIVAERRPTQRSGVALAVLVLMLANYGLRATCHALALRQARSGTTLESAAIPTFFSPFKWRLIRRHDHGYDFGEIDVLARDPSWVWVPSENNEWTSRARESEIARVFLDFSRFPAARTTAGPDGTVIVRWIDLRFPGNDFFVATVGLRSDGRIVSERLGGGE